MGLFENTKRFWNEIMLNRNKMSAVDAYKISTAKKANSFEKLVDKELSSVNSKIFLELEYGENLTSFIRINVDMEIANKIVENLKERKFDVKIVDQSVIPGLKDERYYCIIWNRDDDAEKEEDNIV